MTDHSKHIRLRPEEITEDRVSNTAVYGADDEKVGKISNLHGAGTVAQAVIDVGGFLGIGSKPVAVPVSQLDFMVNESDEIHAVTNWTKDSLKELPAHHH